MKTPLFPTNAILCPQGRIPLQVFEPRYLDMVSHCLKTDSEFVLVMEKSGVSDQDFYRVGTLAKIVDFGAVEQEGVISITAEGHSQVELSHIEQQDDGLWLSDINPQRLEEYVDLPKKYEELKAVLKALVQHPFVQDLNMDIDYLDSRQIGWRLTELLPFEGSQKQSLYEMTDCLSRLETISKHLSEMVE